VPNTTLTIEQVLTLLAETPRQLESLTADVAPTRLHKPLGRDEWSANDVLAHLRACADVWGKCVTTMIAEDRPTLRAVNPRSWIDQTNYRGLDFRRSLGAFARQRADLLAVLKPLPPTGWSRAAAVTGAGAVLERTVLFYGRWIVSHERPHIKQVARIVSRTNSGRPGSG
jgi:hypothetical protein